MSSVPDDRLADLADEGGLTVMGDTGVLGIIRDRAQVAPRILEGLESYEVVNLYDTFIGPAIDALEAALRDTQRCKVCGVPYDLDDGVDWEACPAHA